MHAISDKAVRLVTPEGTVISTGLGSSRRDAEDVATVKALQYYGLRR
jgi:hypothetical protein